MNPETVAKALIEEVAKSHGDAWEKMTRRAKHHAVKTLYLERSTAHMLRTYSSEARCGEVLRVLAAVRTELGLEP